MATEQKFDNGLMLAYDDEGESRIVFALYDHGQWSQWRNDGLWHTEDARPKAPSGAVQVTYSFARAWINEKLSSTMGYASKKAEQFAGTWHRASDGGYRITDSMGRVLLLNKNGLQTWRYLRIEKPVSLLLEY